MAKEAGGNKAKNRESEKTEYIVTLPKYGEHICFCGTTGSGKTYLAEKMLNNYKNIFAFDTHGTLEIPNSFKITNPHTLLLKVFLHSKIRYSPKIDYRTKKWYNYVIKILMTSNLGKEKIIYIDEIYHLGYGASFPDWLARGISTARQRKTSFWISSQRPTNIPMSILTESTKIYCFYLSYEEDIKKLALFVRDTNNFKKEMMKLKYDYSFIEIDRIKGEWKKFPKLTN